MKDEIKFVRVPFKNKFYNVIQFFVYNVKTKITIISNQTV